MPSNEIGFRLKVSEIVDITKAHIHVGTSGEKGISTFKDAVDAVLSGRAYVNVHAVAHPAEEIRGQIKRK